MFFFFFPPLQSSPTLDELSSGHRLSAGKGKKKISNMHQQTPPGVTLSPTPPTHSGPIGTIGSVRGSRSEQIVHSSVCMTGEEHH